MRNDIPPDVAVMFNLLGAGVGWAVHLGQARVGDTALIVGPGQRGLCAVIAARIAGAGTIVLDALECVRHGGRVVLAGLKGRKPISLVTDAIISRGATVIGAFGVDARAYIDAINIIESGAVPLEKMHTHTFGLEDADKAVEVLAGKVPGEQAVHVSIAPAGTSA